MQLLFFLVLLVPIFAAQQRCPKREVWKDCGPADGCMPTCLNPEPGPCENSCKAGCFCKDGFLRDEDSSQCKRTERCEAARRRNSNRKQGGRCHAADESDVCKLPKQPSACAAGKSGQWYFDCKKQKCKRFRQEACGTNANAFDSKEACEQRCAAGGAAETGAGGGRRRGGGGGGGNPCRNACPDHCTTCHVTDTGAPKCLPASTKRRCCSTNFVACDTDPCASSTCQSKPGAICKPDSCGGACKAKWFDPSTFTAITC